MQSFYLRARHPRGRNDAASRGLRFDPVRENRLALGLVVLVIGATVSIVATTSTLSRHMNHQIATELQR